MTEPLIGHAEAAAAFRTAFDGRQMHHAWLLAGPQGIGKAAFARTAAQWVLARAAGPQAGVATDSFDVHPEHPTARLLAARSHLDFRVVERITDPRDKKADKLRREIALDQIVVRQGSGVEAPLRPFLQATPALSDWRVVIVDSVDEMNRNAANALLKSLEEPPPGTLFLCISHAPGRLLPTIRSRCRTLRLQPLSDDDVGRVLDRALPAASDDERAALIRVAAGAPGRALRFAGAGIAALDRELEALAVSSAAEATPRALALARALAAKTATVRYEAMLELAPAALAHAARSRRGARLARALALWEKANALAASAVALSLEPQSVAFELGLLVSGLAEA